MTLKNWQSNGWLRSHKTSAEEIGNLLKIVERDVKDETPLSMTTQGEPQKLMPTS